MDQHENSMANIQKQLASAIESAQRNPSDRGAQGQVDKLRQDMIAARAERNRDINEQTERIKSAKKVTELAKQDVTKVDTELQKMAKDAGINRWAFQDAGDTA